MEKYNFIINLVTTSLIYREVKRVKIRASSFYEAILKTKKRYPRFDGIGCCLIDTKYVHKYGWNKIYEEKKKT